MQTFTFDTPESFDKYNVEDIKEASFEQFNGKLFNELICKFHQYFICTDNLIEFIELQMKLDVGFGKSICIKGNAPCFGNWELSTSDLNKCNYINNCWSAKFPIKELSKDEISFKFVKLNGSIKNYEWESDPNRTIKLSVIDITKEQGEHNKMNYSIDINKKTITFICEWNKK